MVEPLNIIYGVFIHDQQDSVVVEIVHLYILYAWLAHLHATASHELIGPGKDFCYPVFLLDFFAEQGVVQHITWSDHDDLDPALF